MKERMCFSYFRHLLFQTNVEKFHLLVIFHTDVEFCDSGISWKHFIIIHFFKPCRSTKNWLSNHSFLRHVKFTSCIYLRASLVWKYIRVTKKSWKTKATLIKHNAWDMTIEPCEQKNEKKILRGGQKIFFPQKSWNSHQHTQKARTFSSNCISWVH